MKKNTSTMLCVLVFTTLLPHLAMAQAEGEKKAPAAGKAGHSHFTKIPETAEGIWKEIASQQVKLASVVGAKKLRDAHDHGFAIRDLVRALPSKVAADKKPVADAAVLEVNKLASAIDKSSAGGAQKTTEENVKKLDNAVATLKTKLTAN